MNIENINDTPGTLIYTGEYKEQENIIEIISYNNDFYEYRRVDSLNDIDLTENINWLNIIGLNDLEFIKDIGKKFYISDLILEDILNVNHRSKLENIDGKLFCIFKMIYANNKEIIHEHISIFIHNNLVITFQETEGDVFDSLRNRIKTGKGDIRSFKEDYLFYALLDAIVDQYYEVLNIVEYSIDEIEFRVIKGEDHVMEKIYSVRKELIYLRSSIFPIRDIIRNLMTSDYDIVNTNTRAFYNDLNDHLLEVSDNLILCREVTNSLMETYSSSINNNMNKVMTVLTIFSAIFIPLSFLTGFFGMNFFNFPALNHEYGVSIFIVSCIVIAASMFTYFKKKQWF